MSNNIIRHNVAGVETKSDPKERRLMVYLIISIIFMTMLAVLLRMGTRSGAGALGMNTVFRGTSAVVMLMVASFTMDLSRLRQVWDLVGFSGVISAMFFFWAGFAAIKAVQHGHLGISWTILRCSMVLPTLASLFYWHEVPLCPASRTLIMRLGGIAVVTLAVVLLGLDHARNKRALASGGSGKGGSKAWAFWLAAAFFGQGGWEIMLRSTRTLPDDQSRFFFVTMVFMGAFLITLPVMVAVKARLGRKELLYGALLGVCGFVASGSRVWAIRELDGIVVFPVTTVSVMILVQIAGAAIWRERVGKWGLVGFVAAVIGVLALTIRF